MKRENNVELLSPEMTRYCAAIECIVEDYNLPFTRFETGRSRIRQASLMSRGTSRVITPEKAFHLIAPPNYPLADAVDFVMKEHGRWTWGDDFNEEHNEEIHNMYKAFGYIVKAKLGQKVIVGAVDWPLFFDGPHIQLHKRTINAG